MTSRLWILLTLILVAWPFQHAWPQVLQKFDDDSGTPYMPASCLASPIKPTHELRDGGPTEVGRFLRLAFKEEPIPNHNSITFNYVDTGAFDKVVVDFDFRMIPGNGQADGIGFALLDISEFGETGPVCPQEPPFAGEEPNFKGSLGIAFDIHQAPGVDLNNNHVSIHFNGVEQAEFDVTPALSLAGREWIHARILVSPGATSGIEVTIILQQRGGQPFTVVEGFSLWWVAPYKSRVHFAARSGGKSASHDLDNVAVQYMDSTESIVSFSAVSYDIVETSSQAVVTVMRQSNTATSVVVEYETMDASAQGNADYVPTFGTTTFGPGEVEKSFIVVLNDDGLKEGDETFVVSLKNPSSGAVLGGPSMAGVRIVDDESARSRGHWSHIISFPTVAVHVHLLPTGKVMFWQNGGATKQVYLWEPFTGTITQPALPMHDIFCAGHSFLADGRLLVTGGHVTDGVGLQHATIYDPCNNTWDMLSPMGGEGGRWYPTNTTLGDGNVLVLSGSYDELYHKNTLPQVFQVKSDNWRDLSGARELEPLNFGLYPRMFLAPDGTVFKVGDPKSWFLDVSGSGHWRPGPPSILLQARTYGPAVFYDGKVLLVGGGDPPTNRVELIDLNEENPPWVEGAPMAFARRYHNATLLPNGTVLVTGGTSCAGNCGTGAILEAELWDPGTQSWTTLAAMALKRLYHSTSLLLPDGRVLSAGGGRPAAAGEVDHHNAEIFSPPYLFNGPRPTIVSAPAAVGWSEQFLVESPEASNISKVSLIRLGSVTHAFDQNQRFLTLAFTKVAGGLTVTVPSNPNLAPPGHYMLFILNGDGVPSVARLIQLGLPESSPPCAATLVSPVGRITDPTPTYTWNAVPTASWYYLWVNGSSGSKITQWYTAAQASCGGGTGTCAVTPATELANGAGKWWIQTWNIDGYGSWSAGLGFNVQAGPPPPATLITPTGTITDPTPTYTWNAVPTASWYYLWVNDSSGNKIKQWYTAARAGCGAGTGTCAVTLDTKLANGAAKWWIQTWKITGYGPWSAAMAFTVQ